MRLAACKMCELPEETDSTDPEGLRECFLREAATLCELEGVPGVVRMEAPSTDCAGVVALYLRCNLQHVQTWCMLSIMLTSSRQLQFGGRLCTSTSAGRWKSHSRPHVATFPGTAAV